MVFQPFLAHKTIATLITFELFNFILALINQLVLIFGLELGVYLTLAVMNVQTSTTPSYIVTISTSHFLWVIILNLILKFRFLLFFKLSLIEFLLFATRF